MTAAKTTVSVYLDDGRIYEYDVASPIKAREHAAAIVKTGYRHTDNEAGSMEHYPPHRIDKVKCSGGMATNYPDRAAGT